MVQRVIEASVSVDDEVTGAISGGLLVFLGVHKDDTDEDLDYLVKKCLGLRIFPDEDGKMNRCLNPEKDSLLVVSQFTLYGDVRKGFRPSYDQAASLEKAEYYYRSFIEKIKNAKIHLQEGRFRANMVVSIKNSGPVTILIDSEKNF